MHQKLVQISKTISHALRHEPWLYELELDDEGGISLEILLAALRKIKSEWQQLDEKELQLMMEQSEKKRFEIKNGKIRALYGHSTPNKLLKEKAVPPDLLFHGTSPKFVSEIEKEGLLPMRRQYVHLSVDVPTAKQVGSRKAKQPVILAVKAKKANEEGVLFYSGNEHVWLADFIPAKYIEIEKIMV